MRFCCSLRAALHGIHPDTTAAHDGCGGAGDRCQTVQGAGRGSQGAGFQQPSLVAGVQELTAQQAEVQAEAARVQEERLRVGRLKQQLEQAVARLEGERAVWEQQKVGANRQAVRVAWAHACFSERPDGGGAGSIAAPEGGGHSVQCLHRACPCARVSQR